MKKMPQILTSLSGQKITTAVDWEAFRRKEILRLFEEYVYGVRDIEKPENLYFKKKREINVKGMRCKEIEGGFGNFSFPFYFFVPKKTNKPVPVFVYVLIEYHEDAYTFDENGNLTRGAYHVAIKDAIDRGFGIVIMPTRSIYRDWESQDHFKHGVFSEVKTSMGRRKNSWATISAWAWGTSRVMDYLETDPDADETNVAVVGHSRGGKTALWAGATDERFKLSISNNSGCMGAAILRGKVGEHAKHINVTDWFCENFNDYNEREDMLPVDQHMLLALIAPRYAYVASSIRDDWADPDAEYKACQMASEVYKIYFMKGLVGPEKLPELRTPCHEGRIAYHVKEGDHSLTAYDWECYMDYFEKIMNK